MISRSRYNSYGKKKLSETTNLCVEIMNSKRQVKKKLGTNSRLPFDVNVMLNLSNLSKMFTPQNLAKNLEV